MAELPRFYAEARSEIAVMERVKEAADAIGRQFEDREPLQTITDDEALDLAEAAFAATDDGFDWEVIDRTRKPLSRVICRTNRAAALMIAGALNGAERAAAVIQSERDARQLLSDILRQKDEAMGVLFARLSAAHVDCSDLIS